MLYFVLRRAFFYSYTQLQDARVALVVTRCRHRRGGRETQDEVYLLRIVSPSDVTTLLHVMTFNTGAPLFFSPTPKVSWRREGGEAMPAGASFSLFQHEMEINATTFDDSGTYVCQASVPPSPIPEASHRFIVSVECERKHSNYSINFTVFY